MRATWTGTLSFGLVNIPVKLYSASEERAFNFRLLDRETHQPISYRKISDGHEVEQINIVKGYAIDDRFVVLDEEDFKRADAKKTETIDIVQFTDLSEIDPIFFDKPYYIEPDKKSAKAYALLRDALKKNGKAAIARFVLRDKEHVGAITTEGRALILEQLRYMDEIRSTQGLDLPEKTAYSEREMEMAQALIHDQTQHFDPRDYRDTYADELRKIISEKSKGKKSAKIVRTEPVEATDVSEILEMLKKSLKKHPTFTR